jgi:hypothetical protein
MKKTKWKDLKYLASRFMLKPHYQDRVALGETDKSAIECQAHSRVIFNKDIAIHRGKSYVLNN